jgi:hypothetical protein
MSGIAKGVKKIFKAVGKIVKKVAMPLLAVAAIVFTGGAALGLAPLAGGFGGAVASGLSAIGLPTTGALGSVLTGAVTQAGYGAAIGGIGGMATGQGFAKGAAAGGLAGAVTGGLGGLAGGIGGAAAGAAPAASTMGNVTMSARNGLGTALSTAAPAVPNAVAAGPAVAGVAATGPAAPLSAMQRLTQAGGGLGRFIENHPNLTSMAGNALTGLGQGLMTGMAAKEDAQALEDRQNEIAASYSIDDSAYDSAPAADGVDRPTPGEKWDRPSGRYRYDRKSRQIVYG